MANNQRFLSTVDSYEQVMAKGLSLLVCVVVAAASLQLIVSVALRVINPSTNWLGDELMVMLDRLLLILIALLPDDGNPQSIDRSMINESFKKPFDAALLAERLRTLIGNRKELAR